MRTAASGSSPLTWKIGACTALAMSVACTVERAKPGRGGETDLVVDDDVHGAADVVAGELGEVERLRHHALARERGVAVDEHRQHAVVLGVAEPVLLGARHAFGDRVDGFEVARVRGERDADRRARRAP